MDYMHYLRGFKECLVLNQNPPKLNWKPMATLQYSLVFQC